MKITLEETTNDNLDGKMSATVGLDNDDLTLDQIISELFIPVLRAYGFDEEMLEKYFIEE